MLGKSSSGKAVLCSSTFTYHFDTCYFGVLGMIHGKLQIFFPDVLADKPHPRFARSFRVKRCSLYAGVYGTLEEVSWI